MRPRPLPLPPQDPYKKRLLCTLFCLHGATQQLTLLEYLISSDSLQKQVCIEHISGGEGMHDADPQRQGPLSRSLASATKRIVTKGLHKLYEWLEWLVYPLYMVL